MIKIAETGLGCYYVARDTGAICDKTYSDLTIHPENWISIPWLTSYQAGKFKGRLPPELLKEVIAQEFYKGDQWTPEQMAAFEKRKTNG